MHRSRVGCAGRAISCCAGVRRASCSPASCSRFISSRPFEFSLRLQHQQPYRLHCDDRDHRRGRSDGAGLRRTRSVRGMVYALVPFVMHFLIADGIPSGMAIILALAAAGMIRLVNGAITTFLSVPAFVTTLLHRRDPVHHHRQRRKPAWRQSLLADGDRGPAYRRRGLPRQRAEATRARTVDE
jgi:hypothetical protein